MAFFLLHIQTHRNYIGSKNEERLSKRYLKSLLHNRRIQRSNFGKLSRRRCLPSEKPAEAHRPRCSRDGPTRRGAGGICWRNVSIWWWSPLITLGREPCPGEGLGVPLGRGRGMKKRPRGRWRLRDFVTVLKPTEPCALKGRITRHKLYLRFTKEVSWKYPVEPKEKTVLTFFWDVKLSTARRGCLYLCFVLWISGLDSRDRKS